VPVEMLWERIPGWTGIRTSPEQIRTHPIGRLDRTSCRNVDAEAAQESQSQQLASDGGGQPQ